MTSPSHSPPPLCYRVQLNINRTALCSLLSLFLMAGIKSTKLIFPACYFLSFVLICLCPLPRLPRSTTLCQTGCSDAGDGYKWLLKIKILLLSISMFSRLFCIWITYKITDFLKWNKITEQKILFNFSTFWGLCNIYFGFSNIKLIEFKIVFISL